MMGCTSSTHQPPASRAAGKGHPVILKKMPARFVRPSKEQKEKGSRSSQTPSMTQATDTVASLADPLPPADSQDVQASARDISKAETGQQPICSPQVCPVAPAPRVAALAHTTAGSLECPTAADCPSQEREQLAPQDDLVANSASEPVDPLAYETSHGVTHVDVAGYLPASSTPAPLLHQRPILELRASSRSGSRQKGKVVYSTPPRALHTSSSPSVAQPRIVIPMPERLIQSREGMSSAVVQATVSPTKMPTSTGIPQKCAKNAIGSFAHRISSGVAPDDHRRGGEGQQQQQRPKRKSPLKQSQRGAAASTAVAHAVAPPQRVGGADGYPERAAATVTSLSLAYTSPHRGRRLPATHKAPSPMVCRGSFSGRWRGGLGRGDNGFAPLPRGVSRESGKTISADVGLAENPDAVVGTFKAPLHGEKSVEERQRRPLAVEAHKENPPQPVAEPPIAISQPRPTQENHRPPRALPPRSPKSEEIQATTPTAADGSLMDAASETRGAAAVQGVVSTPSGRGLRQKGAVATFSVQHGSSTTPYTLVRPGAALSASSVAEGPTQHTTSSKGSAANAAVTSSTATLSISTPATAQASSRRGSTKVREPSHTPSLVPSGADAEPFLATLPVVHPVLEVPLRKDLLHADSEGPAPSSCGVSLMGVTLEKTEGLSALSNEVGVAEAEAEATTTPLSTVPLERNEVAFLAPEDAASTADALPQTQPRAAAEGGSSEMHQKSRKTGPGVEDGLTVGAVGSHPLEPTPIATEEPSAPAVPLGAEATASSALMTGSGKPADLEWHIIPSPEPIQPQSMVRQVRTVLQLRNVTPI